MEQTFITVPLLAGLFVTGVLAIVFEACRSESYISNFARPGDFSIPIRGSYDRYEGIMKCYIKALPNRPIPRRFFVFRVANAVCISMAIFVFIVAQNILKNIGNWKIANWRGKDLISVTIGILSLSIMFSTSSYFLRPLEVQWLNEYLEGSDANV